MMFALVQTGLWCSATYARWQRAAALPAFSHRAHSSKPAAAASGDRKGQTDRRTDVRPLHRPCSAYYAGRANNNWSRWWVRCNGHWTLIVVCKMRLHTAHDGHLFVILQLLLNLRKCGVAYARGVSLWDCLERRLYHAWLYVGRSLLLRRYNVMDNWCQLQDRPTQKFSRKIKPYRV